MRGQAPGRKAMVHVVTGLRLGRMKTIQSKRSEIHADQETEKRKRQREPTSACAG